MALSQLMMSELCQRLKPGRIAALGYPDIIAPMKDVGAALGDLQGLMYRQDSAAICKRHGLEPREIPDADSFFSLLNMKLDVYDIVNERGCEIIRDLNFPCETERYDYVLDVGTLEHCFNIGQAGFNMANMVELGGFIFHENPFSMGNHGFYGLNPTWYQDFYEDNGFKLIECYLAPRKCEVIKNVPRKTRYVFTGAEANCFAIAQRVEIKTLEFPMQSKYRR